MDLVLRKADGWEEVDHMVFFCHTSLLKDLWRAYGPRDEDKLPEISMDTKIEVEGENPGVLTPPELLRRAGGVADAQTGGPPELEGLVLVKLAPNNTIRIWIKPKRPFVIVPKDVDDE